MAKRTSKISAIVKVTPDHAERTSKVSAISRIALGHEERTSAIKLIVRYQVLAVRPSVQIVMVG